MQNRKDRLRILLEEYWKKELPELIERESYINTDSPLISDVIGPRRAGKTYLMFLTVKKLLKSGVDKRQTLYVNFERRILYPLTPDYFNYLVEIIYEGEILKNKVYLFLDEVRRLKDWEKFVRSIYDEFKGKMKIVISGSTSKLTKSNLSHLLSGRHLTTPVYPLSFREFLRFKGFGMSGLPTEEEKAKTMKFLREYIEYGGFPEVVLNKNKEEYLENLFLDIITRDVAPKVKYPAVLEDLACLLTSLSAKTVSFSKLSRLLGSRGIKISVPTLEKYFYLMKDAFLFSDNRIYSFKIKDQLQHPGKIYCIDTGFVNYFGFKFSEDRGRLIENLVATELHRRFPHGKTKIFYWKDYQGNEVDFVVKEGIKVNELIQVTYANGQDEIEKRETRALLKASRELKCNNLKIITWDYKAEENMENRKIVYTPLWKWLLEIKQKS
ncbi:MAG: ATP-binding protein [Thermoplasmatales archaeon]|nr:ATP-binding protein [Thermoplasmatales archaeon]